MSDESDCAVFRGFIYAVAIEAIAALIIAMIWAFVRGVQ